MINGTASYMPEVFRQDAAKVVTLAAIGYQPAEIAETLGISPRRVAMLKQEAGKAVVAEMRADNYTEAEIIRTLGVPTQAYLERYAVERLDV